MVLGPCCVSTNIINAPQIQVPIIFSQSVLSEPPRPYTRFCKCKAKKYLTEIALSAGYIICALQTSMSDSRGREGQVGMAFNLSPGG